MLKHVAPPTNQNCVHRFEIERVPVVRSPFEENTGLLSMCNTVTIENSTDPSTSARVNKHLLTDWSGFQANYMYCKFMKWWNRQHIVNIQKVHISIQKGQVNNKSVLSNMTANLSML